MLLALALGWKSVHYFAFHCKWVTVWPQEWERNLVNKMFIVCWKLQDLFRVSELHRDQARWARPES